MSGVLVTPAPECQSPQLWLRWPRHPALTRVPCAMRPESSEPDLDSGSRRKEVFGALLVALAVYAAGLIVLPTPGWEAAFAVPWGLLSALTVDHLHGDREFTTARKSVFQTVFPPLLCLVLAAGTVADLFDGIAQVAVFIAVGALLIVVMDAVGQRLRPRYRGGGVGQWG